MFWLVIGIIGVVVYLVGMFLCPVWMGGASYMDALIVFLSTIAIVVFVDRKSTRLNSSHPK